MNKIVFFIITALLLAPARGKAQCEFSAGADFVSSYVWRGVATAGTSIQPSMDLSVGGFSIGAWGSVDMAGQGYKEVDLAASYTIGGFYVGLTDYWWNGEDAFDYFHFKKDESSHLLEASLGYEFDFGLGFSWNTMIAGTGDQYIDGESTKRAFSTYAEVGYSFAVKEVELTAAVGASPWNSNVLYTGYERDEQQYGTSGFAVTNISLAASKEVTITDRFSPSLFGQLAFNPAKEDVFLVFGLSFKF
jgi:hypothetical protein